MGRDCLLGDVLTLQRGYDLPSHARREGPIPIVSSSGVTGTHAEAKVAGPGVVTGRYGTLGEIHYVSGAFWPLNTTLYVRDFKGNDPRFVAYFLQTLNFANRSAAAAVPGINRNDLHRIPVHCPDLQQQRCIASILSAYDDLIENNTRRIAILEEMARRIYEEWFVRFRFPGFEAGRMVESELGLVPEGWELTSLGAVAENHDRFRRPLSKMEREDFKGPYPYYGAAKIFDYVREYLFDGQFLLLAEDGSVETPDGFPVLQLTDGKFWANNHTHILRGAKRVSTEYLYLRLERQPIRGYITGAAQPKLTQAAINRIPLVLPQGNLLREFDAHIRPLFQLRATLIRANTNLRTTRDLLLPKLISGELDVSVLPEPEALAA
jgi:type I restriction enzyme, S subunit